MDLCLLLWGYRKQHEVASAVVANPFDGYIVGSPTSGGMGGGATSSSGPTGAAGTVEPS